MERCIEFDFEHKIEREIEMKKVPDAMARGKFVWIDLETRNPGHVHAILSETLSLSSDVISKAMSDDLDCSYDATPNALHLGLVGCRMQQADLQTMRVNVIIGERFLVTYCREFTGFIGEVRKAYRSDFMRFAKSPSFLIYEIWDHLIRSYEQVVKGFEEEVERVQRLLVGEVDDSIFRVVSRLGSELLYFRKQVAPARGVLNELATRKSLFVSEATQPFLLDMVQRIERILADVVLNRDIVRDSLELYMSMVGYRTNQVMNRLTIVTFLFMPLTFLSGIYGMEHIASIPDITFGWFWMLSGIMIAITLLIMRRMKLL